MLQRARDIGRAIERYDRADYQKDQLRMHGADYALGPTIMEQMRRELRSARRIAFCEDSILYEKIPASAETADEGRNNVYVEGGCVKPESVSIMRQIASALPSSYFVKLDLALCLLLQGRSGFERINSDLQEAARILSELLDHEGPEERLLLLRSDAYDALGQADLALNDLLAIVRTGSNRALLDKKIDRLRQANRGLQTSAPVFSLYS